MQFLTRFVAVGALIGLLTVTGCTSQDEPVMVTPSGPYADSWAKAFEGMSSEFERRALADGEISRAEYDEAHQLWLECMHQEFPPGSSPSVRLNVTIRFDLYEYIISSVKEEDVNRFQVWDMKCQEGTIEYVAPLYGAMMSNPNGLSFPALLFPCLQEKGAVPDGYTVEEYERDFFTDGSDENRDVPIPTDGNAAVFECIQTI